MVVIMGIGNSHRGDDKVGLHVAKMLEERGKILLCDTDPLDFVEEICGEQPDILIIVDAVDAGREAGEIIQVDEDMLNNLSVSTHHLPISLFLEFVRKCVGKIEIWGIQVKKVGFEDEMGDEVKKAADKLVKLLNYRLQKD